MVKPRPRPRKKLVFRPAEARTEATIDPPFPATSSSTLNWASHDGVRGVWEFA